MQTVIINFIYKICKPIQGNKFKILILKSNKTEESFYSSQYQISETSLQALGWL